jgi:hypothetical protein
MTPIQLDPSPIPRNILVLYEFRVPPFPSLSLIYANLPTTTNPLDPVTVLPEFLSGSRKYYGTYLLGIFNINLWCNRLSHCYFYTNKFKGPKFPLFLISLVKVLLL